MKKLFLGALAVVILALGILTLLPTKAPAQPASATPAPQTCPTGSYDIGISKDGQLICKLEPTGCPYGDSIPLGADCDKHAPIQVQEPAPVQEPEPVILMEGK